MTLTSTQKMILVLFLVILLIGLGYYLYNGITPGVADLSVTSEAETLSQEILGFEAKLNSIEVDQSFFTSNTFLSLTDQSVPLTPELQGRPNPFAAIGSDGVSTATLPKSSGN